MGLRFFNVYGPYQQEISPYSGVITHFINNLLADKPLVIYGDGQQTRDFVFVEDVINNAIHAMKILKKGAHVANICTGNTVTIYKLAQLLSTMLEKKLVIDYTPPRRSDVKDSCGSQKKMNAYGFMVNHNLEQGLIKTTAYFKAIHG
jgi:UDP-glucose 4-epimerase